MGREQGGGGRLGAAPAFLNGNTPAPSSPVPDADAYIVKAELVIRIDAMIRQRDATRAEAKRLFGLSQPDMLLLFGGGYSPERQLRLLTAPGRNIRQSRSADGRELRIAAAEIA